MRGDGVVDGGAEDEQPTPVWANGQGWLVSWHCASNPPDGTPHGAEGVCLTTAGDVVLVSQDGVRWSLPAGRPELGETWEDTLRREVLEEACHPFARILRRTLHEAAIIIGSTAQVEQVMDADR
jgi:hypothetical protein